MTAAAPALDSCSPHTEPSLTLYSIKDPFHSHTATRVHLSICQGRFGRQSETRHGWTAAQGSHGRFIPATPGSGSGEAPLPLPRLEGRRCEGVSRWITWWEPKKKQKKEREQWERSDGGNKREKWSVVMEIGSEAEEVKRPKTQTFVFEANTNRRGKVFSFISSNLGKSALTIFEFGTNASSFCNYIIITIFSAFSIAASLASSHLRPIQNFQLAFGLMFLDCDTAAVTPTHTHTVPTAAPPCYPLEVIWIWFIHHLLALGNKTRSEDETDHWARVQADSSAAWACTITNTETVKGAKPKCWRCTREVLATFFCNACCLGSWWWGWGGFSLVPTERQKDIP